MRTLLALLIMAIVTVLPLAGLTPTTVKQLDELLAQMQQQVKSDDAVANRLKNLELSEQLLPSVMDGFARYRPGPSTVAQIWALALESALLPPPTADLPAAPAPDQKTQVAIMGRAVTYITMQFAHLPRFTADKETTRFQNGQDIVRAATSVGGQSAHSDLGFTPINPYFRLLGSHTTPVVVGGGVELPPAKQKKGDPAGQNGQISQGGAGPVLGVILMDAAASAKIVWR